MGMSVNMATLGRSFAISYKAKPTATLYLAILLLDICSKEINKFTYEMLTFMHIQSMFIYHGKKFRTT